VFYRINVSVATLIPQASLAANVLIEQADQALYLSKAQETRSRFLDYLETNTNLLAIVSSRQFLLVEKR
jgi:hypothetical protein